MAWQVGDGSFSRVDWVLSLSDFLQQSEEALAAVLTAFPVLFLCHSPSCPRFSSFLQVHIWESSPPLTEPRKESWPYRSLKSKSEIFSLQAWGAITYGIWVEDQGVLALSFLICSNRGVHIEGFQIAVIRFQFVVIRKLSSCALLWTK